MTARKNKAPISPLNPRGDCLKVTLMNASVIFKCLVGLQLALMMAAGHASAAVVLTNRFQLRRPPGKPNIIFIMADDLGYGDLGCYGQKKISTPRIDQLAADGIRFTSCYAGSTVCAPSRCALMTGLHTGHARIRGNANVSLEASDLTVAEILKKAGYRTGIFGKWGLGNEGMPGTPNKKGFDEWRGFLDQTLAHNYYPDYIWANEEKIRLPQNENNQKGQYVHDMFSVAAVNFIRINQYRPFFLYLAYTIPHANNEAFRATGNGMEVPEQRQYAGEKWPEPEKNKAAMISRMDLHVGKIMETLQTYGLDQDTIVFFTSDNGPHKEGGNDPKFFESQGGLRGIKRDLYEGGIRVPMIVRWPSKIKAGTVSDFPWAFWDFLPTAADIAKVKLSEKMDGISVLPALLGNEEEQKPHEFFYWEFHEGGSKQAVRMGDWKAVRLAPGKPVELFNLRTDLAESENVAAKNPAVVAKIDEYLKIARTESEQWPLKEPPAKKAPAAKP
jgi:arylsulfatase A-like enzyme